MIFRHRRKQTKPPSPPVDQSHDNPAKLTGNLETDLRIARTWIGDSDDINVRHIQIFDQFHAVVIYYTTLVDNAFVYQDVHKPLMYRPRHLEHKSIHIHNLMDTLMHETLYISEATHVTDGLEVLNAISEGSTVLLIDGLSAGLVLDTRRIEQRGIEQPQTEHSIRGPKDGFIEVLDSNITLLRTRIKAGDFRVKIKRIGKRTNTRVALCYIESIANPELLHEAERRLSLIDIDGILDSGYIEQFIEDHPYSPFPQIQNTERPDKATSAILDGRVVIMVDGFPFTLIIPAVFNQFYQVTDDYSERFIMGSLVRFIRLLAIVFSLVFPALYVSIISFNPEMIPTDFAVAVAGGRAGVPFPAVVEVLLIEISMEVLREATLRLPQQIGGALSIVGVLVVGEAAVAAGFASPITVVVIALTTIGSFATPAYNAAISIRMLRFPILIASGFFGLYGVMLGLIIIVNHLLFLDSFGVPYMNPITPVSKQGFKDTLIRGPIWKFKKRPSFLYTLDDTRIGTGDKPTSEPVLQPSKQGE
ncbi:spore germination protein [Paenibacillus sp. JCM 10914]|uniref:spore germination protein n=1 Tax=Paenibacillus sp. JCM 10914 TaxID=1236974 RepID=UPI0003CC45F1|nr:spore germination protein [Paenibacillus sp. JCM 10914]GAE08372.1 spore germination protein GerKA [Paenibacillus sp. JCM 10914]